MSRHIGTGGKRSENGRTSVVCDYSNAKTGHGSKATKSIKCETDDEVVDAMIAETEGHDFVFGRLVELANHTGCKTNTR